MKAGLSLILSLVLALASAQMAVARGHGAPTMWAELCGAHGEARVIALDSHGKPVPLTPCPDCVPGHIAVLPDAGGIAATERGFSPVEPPRVRGWAVWRWHPVRHARGPPVRLS